MSTQERDPVIKMGDGNSNNKITICGMDLQSAVLLGALILNIGVTWNKVNTSEMIIAKLTETVQVLETRVSNHDAKFESLGDSNKEMKETVNTFNNTVNKLSETVARLDGKLSK
ncbi:MAG TPA: hypothetical protein VEZ91_09905 [Kurthia gibsonii]|uniref:hypothetical protein n=1 Tax=Aeromonas hydrophila TaxID=644 RepID=UPI00107EDE15|nr:hypothetical protein [Aeromonas hydrophila]QBX71093.1 hypothetical protein E4625_09740 [Aeromonas hydrophila]HZG12297.1 hypothetical protein [Kurthia gibsonii]